MEEALRCRAIGAVIGELRHGEIDMVTLRRLSLAAAESGALALLLARGAADRRLHRRHPLDRRGAAIGDRKCRASPRNSSATAAARSAHGFSNGVTAMSASCSQRLLSLWLRRLSTDRIVRSRDKSREVSSPLVIYGKRGNAELIVAVDEAAERLGLHAGLALAQARAMHPALEAIAEDAEADASLLEKIADWCLRYTPLVAVDAPDGLTARHRRLRASLRRRTAAGRRSGRAHRAGRLRLHHRHRRQHRRRLGRRAFRRAGEATPAARSAACSRRCRLPRCGFPPTPSRRWRASASSASATSSICRAAPSPPASARDLLRQLDRALGHEHEPLNPRLPVAPYVAEQRFAEPIAREEDVLAILTRLAARLQFALERRGDGARRLELTLFRTDGEVRRIAAGTSRPLRDPAQIRALFVERLAALADEFDPGFGFDMARLSVLVAEPSPPEQIGIGGGEDAAEVDRQVDQLADRLSARLGARRVRRLIAQDSHIPEIAAASVPAQAASRGRRGLAGVPPFPRRGGSGAAAAAAAARGRSRSRRWRKCRTARLCDSDGGARCTR